MSEHNAAGEKDSVTGRHTTGHEWVIKKANAQKANGLAYFFHQWPRIRNSGVWVTCFIARQNVEHQCSVAHTARNYSINSCTHPRLASIWPLTYATTRRLQPHQTTFACWHANRTTTIICMTNRDNA